jgi:phospholipase/carboxylesterase
MAESIKIGSLKFVHLPPREDGPKRLLVVLHGLGDSLEGYRFLPDLLRIPGLHYLLLNAPTNYFTGYSWFDLGSDLGPGVVKSRKLLFAAIQELEQSGWAPEQIGFLGFSQGCLMVLDLACRYPKKFGCVVGISGFVGFLEEYPEKFSSIAREQQILVTHGTEDPMLPIEKTRQQIQALQGMGLKILWQEYPKEHTINEEEVRDISFFLRKHLMKQAGGGK